MRSTDPAVQKVISRINRDRERARRRLSREHSLLHEAARWTVGEKIFIAALVIANVIAWSWIWQHDAASHRALEAQGEHRWHETP